MKILVGLIVVMNGFSLHASESSTSSSSSSSRSLSAPSSPAPLAASLIASVKLTQPDAEKRAQYLLHQDAITEQARKEAIQLLIASKPIAQIQEGAARVETLIAERDQLASDAQKRTENIAWCKVNYARYLQMHQEVNVEVGTLFDRFLERRQAMPYGKSLDVVSSDSAKLTQMITLLNALKLADLTTLTSKERATKIAEIKSLLFAFEVKELQPGTPELPVRSEPVSDEPVSTIEEALLAKSLVKKQYRLQRSLEENALLLSSLEEEAQLYEGKIAALEMQIRFATEQLEGNKKKAADYTTIIAKLHEKPTRADRDPILKKK